jgi:hypothetical protein
VRPWDGPKADRNLCGCNAVPAEAEIQPLEGSRLRLLEGITAEFATHYDQIWQAS